MIISATGILIMAHSCAVVWLAPSVQRSPARCPFLSVAVRTALPDTTTAMERRSLREEGVMAVVVLHGAGAAERIALQEIVQDRRLDRSIGDEAMAGFFQPSNYHREFRPGFSVHDRVGFDGCRAGGGFSQRGFGQRVNFSLHNCGALPTPFSGRRRS